MLTNNGTELTQDTDIIIDLMENLNPRLKKIDLMENLNPRLKKIAEKHFPESDDISPPKTNVLTQQKPQQVAQIIGESNPQPKIVSNKQNPILPIIDETIKTPELKINTKELKIGESTFIFTIKIGDGQKEKTLIFDGLSSKATHDGGQYLRMKTRQGKYYIWNGVMSPPEKIIFGIGQIVEIPDNKGKIKQHRKYHIIADSVKSVVKLEEPIDNFPKKTSWLIAFGSKHKK